MPEGYFGRLPYLSDLDLSENMIKVLGANSFVGAGNLRNVDLSSMNLSYINPSAFVPLIYLQCLDVSDTLLLTVPYVWKGGQLPMSTYSRYLDVRKGKSFCACCCMKYSPTYGTTIESIDSQAV